MNTRRTRKLLWLTTTGLIAGAVAVVAAHIAAPVRVTPQERSGKGDALPDDQNADRLTAPQVDGDRLERVAYRDIRQRLFDPPVEQPKPPPPKPVPPIELISTILRADGNHSAWVRDGQAVKKTAVGDPLGPEDNTAVIKSIASGKIVIEHENESLELLQGPEHATGGGRRR